MHKYLSTLLLTGMLLAVPAGLFAANEYIEEVRLDIHKVRWTGKAKVQQGADGLEAATWETPAGIREIYGIDLDKDVPYVEKMDTVTFDYQLSNHKAWFGLRINDFPYHDGLDCIWYLRNIPDNNWHTYTAELAQPTAVWGQPIKNRRLLLWRVHSTKEQPTTVRLRNIVYHHFNVRMKPRTDHLEWQSLETVRIPIELENRLPQTFTGTLSVEGNVALMAPVNVRLEAGAKTVIEPCFDLRQLAAKPFDKVKFRVKLLDADGKEASFAQVQTLMNFPQPAGPTILFTNARLADIRRRLEKDTPQSRWWHHQFMPLVDSFLTRQITLPNRGSQWPAHYTCVACGGGLKMRTPTEHVCTRCGKVYSGWPYDDCPLYGEHVSYAEMAEYLGIAYAVTRKPEYAQKAKAVLLEYAKIYPTYKLHDNNDKPNQGGGFAFSEALHESRWHIRLTAAFDCIRDTLSREEYLTIAENVLLHFARYVRTTNHNIHNHECWHLCAAALVGFTLDLPEYVHDALYGQVGMENQIRLGTTDDGPWFEGTWGYHFFTLQALEPVTTAALNNGIDMRTDRYRSMYEAPFQQLTPTYHLPAFHDSTRVSFVPAKMFAQLYEGAQAWWPSPLFSWWLAQSDRCSLAAILRGTDLQKGAQPSFVSKIYPAAGFGILRTASTDLPKQLIPHNYLGMDFGDHGGWHGHGDKLSLVLWLRNVMFAEDSGCTSYANPRYGEWYKLTISHNTVMLDGKSQAPATGKCLAFATSDAANLLSCDAGPVYQDAILQRHVALVGDVVFDLFTVRTQQPRDIVWLFHARDDRKRLPGDSCAAPNWQGAKWGEDWHAATHDGRWAASWESQQQELQLVQQSPAGTVYSCRGLTVPTNERYYLRGNQIHSDRALFASVLAAAPAGKPATVEILQSSLEEDGSCTLSARVNGHEWLFQYNASGICQNGDLQVTGHTLLMQKGEQQTVLVAP